MRRYGYGLGIFVAGFAASYVFIYLYRWEWNRALMSAALLIIAEVALIGAALFDRLRRIEARLDAGASPGQLGSPAAPAPQRLEFAWLREPGEPADRFGVFIPVLMGAGLALTGLAWLVERIARGASALGGKPRSPHLAALSLPPGGPFQPAEPRFGDVPPRTPKRRRIAATLGALAIAGPGVFLLAELTQSRPDPPATAAASVVTLEASSTGGWASHLAARVERRWEFCRDTGAEPINASDLLGVEERRFVGMITPALGEQAERRFAGCLADAAVDSIQLRVVSVEDVAAGR